YSGSADVVVGSPIAGRTSKEVEDLIGLFVNTLVLRTDLSGDPSFREVLHRVRDVTLGAYEHQDLPFEKLVAELQPERSLAHSPLFQVMFTLQNMDLSGGTLAGLEVAAAPADFDTTKFDLALDLAAYDGGLVGSFTYSTDLFDRSTIERVRDHLERVLEQVAASAEVRLSELALLGDADRRQLLEVWNDTAADFPSDLCVHELFETQAERTPELVAVVFEGESLTYSELNRRANQLAHHLRAMGVGPDARVAIAVERGPEMMVGLLGVLKAGGAYVPLDPAYPAERLRYTLRDSAPAVLLTQSSLADRFADMAIPTVTLDGAAWTDQPETNPERAGVTPEHLAYVIYTSGSTGQPKGVMNIHRGVVNLLTSMRASLGVEAGDRLLAVTTLAFDISVLELFLPLVSGAQVEILPRAASADPMLLQSAIAESGATLMQATPATWRLLVESDWAGAPTLRALSGGEALPAELAGRIRERVGALWNVYGPTETTIWSCAKPVDDTSRGDRVAVSIGSPIANTQVYVLDAAGEPVPVGVAGELYIGGAGVARGYLNRAATTAERFVPDAFSKEAGARMYRTGDLARWLADGTLEFLGRTDFQVKVRGFRIELGEIEARLAQHEGVREAVVAAREDVPGDTRLVAYWTGDAVDAQALRAHLAERLPEHMVPAAYVHLEAMPLTPNGKLDRKALPSPDGAAYSAREYEAPVGATETALAEIWAEVLGVERVGRWDNFFELGGHSLIAVTLISRMRRRGLHAEVRALFTTPTLAGLAGAVTGESNELRIPANGVRRGEPITPDMLPLADLTQAEIDRIVARVPGGAANVQDIYPLAPLQEGILFHHLLSGE
ncbi:MAG TPA: amino acid adenylation domain-containing protein, partial [Longimicrobium sp.]